jgi:RsiW-degrading membrane proteinase PrsW (M82 family)
MNILPSVQKNSSEAILFLPQATVPRKWHVLAPLVAVCGGLFGILGAAVTEFFHGSFLVAFFGAPVIEEALKPSGVYLLLAKWPRVLAFKNKLYTGFLAALAGITFSVIENLVYLHIYVRDPSPHLILWRYTVGLSIHAVCSFIFGLGINQELLASIEGQTKLLSSGKRFFFTAVALHSSYNIAVTIAQAWFGWMK